MPSRTKPVGALTRTRRVLALAGVTAAAACHPRPDPLSVTLYGDAHVGRPPAALFTNANGSRRVASGGDFDAFYSRVVPTLERDATDPKLQIDPNYVAAILVKESGLDTLAVSPVPAIGLAQLTARADSDLRAMTTSATTPFAWMAAEATNWPRDASFHAGPSAPGGSAEATRTRIAGGALTSRNEYLLDPVTSARAAEFWIRLLQNKWTADGYPGGYGTFARQKLGLNGQPLDADQLTDLVTVSYNQGYVWTRDAVDRYGRDWVLHLSELGAPGAEAADYLARVRAYTRLLQRGEVPPQYRAQQRR